MIPLFFVGNRRSGTTMLTYLLNEHPHIYMGNESDICWYLFTNRSGVPHVADPVDGLEGSKRWRDRDQFIPDAMLSTTPREAVFQDLLFLQAHGWRNQQDPYPEKELETLRVLGDKRPEVTCDPQMQAWFRAHFPDAKYLHLVRDPRWSIASMHGMGWHEDLEILVSRWIRLETLALDYAEALFLRYEDVVADPVAAMGTICAWLGLEAFQPQFDAGGQVMVRRGVIMPPAYASAVRRGDPAAVPTERLRRFMDLYGYA